MSTELTVNGQRHLLEEDPSTPLLWVLRDNLGMTGTKFGCGVAQCGACTVHLDGIATRSCVITLAAVAGKSVTTIESLLTATSYPLQQVWVEMNVPQCGYCQAGVLMAVAALLDETPQPTDEDIDARITNLCRCGTYLRIRAAIHEVVRRHQAKR